MYQKVIVAGNLGSDPALRYTPDGTPVTSFSVAVNRRWTDKDGRQQERVVWFRVTAWKRLAETCAQYLAKGRPVLVEGTLTEPKPYEGKDGQWRASLDVTATTVKFLGGREDAPKEGSVSGTAQRADRRSSVSPRTDRSATAPANGAAGRLDAVDEQEIPF